MLTLQITPSPTTRPTKAKSVFTRQVGRKLAPKKRPNCDFFATQAGVSGDETSDDENHDLESFLNDSLICNEEVEDHPDVDMRAKYLASIKSPIARPGRFKIPERVVNNLDIFSQIPSSEDSEDEMDSFVVDNSVEVSVVNEVGEFSFFNLIFFTLFIVSF